MDQSPPEGPVKSRSFDSAYSFSFVIAIGLLLFIAGLVITLTLGEGASIGLVFGIPLLAAGLVLPLFMMRGQFKQNVVSADCPYCATPIKTMDSTIRLECPNCKHVVVVRDMKMYRLDGEG